MPPKAEYRPLPPAEAIAYFRRKGFKTSFDWYEMWQEDHARAFTVAKAMRLDVLVDIRGEVDRAIAEGITLSEFRKNLEPTLQRKGWWGRKTVGDREVQLGSPARLRTIFQTNVNVAYSAGRYRQMMDPDVLAERPYLQYDAVNDSRTRPQHLAWDGMVLPADDPFWETHYPPNGWGCRCSAVSVSKEEMDAEGLSVGKAPDLGTAEWVNPATGVVEDVPVGIDPGWAYNPGKAYMEWDGSFEGDFRIRAGQKIFSDYGRPRIQDVPDNMRLSSPDKLPRGASIDEVASVIGIPAGKRRRIAKTGIGEEVVISRDRLPHMLAKAKEAREQYAGYVIPTLTDPFETYLVEFENPSGYREFRTHYIGLFQGEKRENLLAVVNVSRDGGVLWNIMQAKKGTINRQRTGTLLYGK